MSGYWLYLTIQITKPIMKVSQETMRPVWDNIEETFLRRFSEENGGPKKGTKAYEKQKVEFFTGAMAALHATLASPLTETANEQEENGLSMPAFWVLPLLSGRELKCEETK